MLHIVNYNMCRQAAIERAVYMTGRYKILPINQTIKNVKLTFPVKILAHKYNIHVNKVARRTNSALRLLL